MRKREFLLGIPVPSFRNVEIQIRGSSIPVVNSISSRMASPLFQSHVPPAAQVQRQQRTSTTTSTMIQVLLDFLVPGGMGGGRSGDSGIE